MVTEVFWLSHYFDFWLKTSRKRKEKIRQYNAHESSAWTLEIIAIDMEIMISGMKIIVIGMEIMVNENYS